MLSIRPITGLLTAAALVSSSEAADGPSTPDMSGWWSRLTFGFELPDSGAGPVGRLRGGQVGQGNFDSPILTPLAAAVMKERGARAQVGDYPIPSSQCLPMASPYILRVQEIQLLQKKDEVLFLFMQDHQVRRVRLNAQHPTHVTPSW